MMIIKKGLPYLFLLLPAICFSQTNTIDLTHLLKQFYDFSSLPKYEENTYSAEVSTYDRTGGNDDGFNGTYSFIRKNPDSSLVIFEQKGPGVINRIWTPTPTKDTLDFYIDDTLHKAFSICYTDLFSGKVYQFTAPLCNNQLGGYYSYLPIPFNKFCKIVLKGKHTQFHQIGYRLYKSNVHVKKISLQLTDDEKAALEKIKKVWQNPEAIIKNINNVTSTQKIITLKPGETSVAFTSGKSGRIEGFEIISQTILDTIAKNIDLKITWDDDKQPAVYCPLADYFGYAFGKASMMGLMAGSDGKKHYSWFPMPYDKSAKIELIYRNSNNNNTLLSGVTLLVKVYTQNKKRDVATEGKFYAAWNNENPVATGKPYTMLDVKGKGHLAGVVLQAQGLKPGMTLFFEGDDSTVVDSETRFHGTGSEDFFNGGWYALLDRWNDAMSLPLSGSLYYSTALSRTGGYRYFLTDKISFNTSLLQTIEHGPQHNLFPSDYTSVSYYYCDRNNAQTIFPNNKSTAIYKPDTLEFYPQITPSAMDGNVYVEAKWDGPAKKMFYAISDASLLKFYFKDIPAGAYTVYINYDKGMEAAAFSVWQTQTQISGWIDAYAPSTQKFQTQKAGTIQINQLNQTISFRFKTTAERNKFTLAKIVFVKDN
ncbi:MAG: glycoside hydrolase family 172 protein [Parafilimonas sp.]